MRTLVKLSLVPMALALAACGHGNRTASSDPDLQRDLKLAKTTTMDLAGPRVNPANFSTLETVPPTAPTPAKHLKKAAGPQVVASTVPQVKAAVAPELSITQNVPQTVSAAAPSLIGDPLASVPRGGGLTAAGASDYGRAPDDGTGAGSGMGGVVIRGGGIDGDHCEPHGGRPVFIPGGTMGIPVFRGPRSH